MHKIINYTVFSVTLYFVYFDCLKAHLKKWADVIITVATQAQQTSGAKIPRKAEEVSPYNSKLFSWIVL